MTDVGAAPGPRSVLFVGHTGREEALRSVRDAAKRFAAAGVAVRVLADEAAQLDLTDVAVVARTTRQRPRAASWSSCSAATAPCSAAPSWPARRPPRCSGVNLGHVGFLAEAERDAIDATVDRVVARDYTVEERLTVDVTVTTDGDVVGRGWALNEASIEKASRQRLLEVVVEIDGRPLSRWGCDGVVMATPTGSTAYAFSAGGPVVWPEVEALLLVPISAHALFARPLVVSPDSVLAVEVLSTGQSAGVLWCDGRRMVDLPPGARIEARRGERPVELARLHSAPFTDRLVAKFDLPVLGWRGRPGAPGSDRPSA